MTHLRPKNFFEAYKFCNFVAQFVGAQFITIKKDKIGKYFAKTSKLDGVRIITCLFLGVWMTKYVLEISMENSARSVIFEIMTVVNGKFQGDHSFLVIIQFVILRHEYFKILRNIHEIDEKVSKIRVTFFIET